VRREEIGPESRRWLVAGLAPPAIILAASAAMLFGNEARLVSSTALDLPGGSRDAATWAGAWLLFMLVAYVVISAVPPIQGRRGAAIARRQLVERYGLDLALAWPRLAAVMDEDALDAGRTPARGSTPPPPRSSATSPSPCSPSSCSHSPPAFRDSSMASLLPATP
jgi:hypothetical protein